MTDLRTLPIRLDPLPEEALDSWLETLAFRMHMPVGDLLRSLGLKRRTRLKAPEEPPADWMIQLQLQEAATLAALTGTTASQVMSMTLAVYDGRALLIDPTTGRIVRRRLWGRPAGSRYCPHCLAETGGRWSLSWRLGWSFACLRHQCLLADACPGCGRMQRIRRYRGNIPIHPAHCSYPAAGRTPSTRCGTDLRDALPVRLDAGHPALYAQRVILDIIEAGQASFGVYAGLPTASVHALADMKAIAGRALAPPSADGLSQHLPGDLLSLYQEAKAGSRPPGSSPYTLAPHAVSASPGFQAPSHATVAAAGVLAAVDVLGCPSIQAAGRALRWLTTEARSSGRVVNTSTAAEWGRGTSTVFDGIMLASLQPVLRPSHQLRYRVMSSCPSRPDLTTGRLNTLTRGTPTLLWPYWALRLGPSSVSARSLRAALSVLVLLPGTKASVAQAAAMLGNAITRAETSRIVQVLEDMPQWGQILTVLTRLSDYLAGHPAPIDYQRRRALGYESLLPDDEWEQICRKTGTPRGNGHKIHLARAYLYQRISASPCDTRPAGVTIAPSDFRAQLAVFPARLFPELNAQLDEAAQRFLAAQGITGEPVAWQPGLDLIDDLHLPGPDPASIPIAGLHRLLYDGNRPVKAALALGTTADAVRAVLAEHPAPARRISRREGQGHLSGPRTWAAEIPKNELERLYFQERLSTKQIAVRYHMQAGTVADLLRSHGIPVGWRPPVGVTLDWLQQEYVEKGRTFNDLAPEVGCSPVTLSRWAKKWGLPVRPPRKPAFRPNTLKTLKIGSASNLPDRAVPSRGARSVSD